MSVDPNDINLIDSSDKTDETRIAESVVKHEYTILFNELTENKKEKYLTNEEFKTAVKTKFGNDNFNVNRYFLSISLINNLFIAILLNFN